MTEISLIHLPTYRGLVERLDGRTYPISKLSINGTVLNGIDKADFYVTNDGVTIAGYVGSAKIAPAFIPLAGTTFEEVKPDHMIFRNVRNRSAQIIEVEFIQ